MSPETRMTDDEIRELAKARVGFKTHALTYVGVNLLLIGIWYFQTMSGSGGEGRGGFWPIWPLLGWGIGLAFHAFGVYGPGKNWEAREEARLREQLRRSP